MLLNLPTTAQSVSLSRRLSPLGRGRIVASGSTGPRRSVLSSDGRRDSLSRGERAGVRGKACSYDPVRPRATSWSLSHSLFQASPALPEIADSHVLPAPPARKRTEQPGSIVRALAREFLGVPATSEQSSSLSCCWPWWRDRPTAENLSPSGHKRLAALFAIHRTSRGPRRFRPWP